MRVLFISLFLWTAVSAGNNPCPNACSGMGNCDLTTETCSCFDGCFGDDCSVFCSPSMTCSGMGECIYDSSANTAACQCNPGCYGPDCSVVCPNDCSGMGTCDPGTGTCTCNEGCYGDDCSVVCPNDCSGMGTCTLPAPVDCTALGANYIEKEGHCYFFNGIGCDINDARDACKTIFGNNQEGKLYEPMTSRIYDMVFDAFSSKTSSEVWIGAHDTTNEGQFTYFSGGPLQYANWYVGEPNDYYSGEDCVELYTSTGEWNDDQCNKLQPSICEKVELGTCVCAEGCYGVDCSQFTCPNDCSGMGTCDSTTGTCTCNAGCYGDDCSQFTCPNDCSGFGTCDSTTGLCICYAGCSGDDCSQFTYLPCPGDGTCSNQGICDVLTGTCHCDCGFQGDMCQDMQCGGDICCSNHGTCDVSTGTCTCEIGFQGDTCEDMQCPGDGTCSNQGTCDVSTGTCTCNPGFLGPECSIIAGIFGNCVNEWCLQNGLTYPQYTKCDSIADDGWTCIKPGIRYGNVYGPGRPVVHSGTIAYLDQWCQQLGATKYVTHTEGITANDPEFCVFGCTGYDEDKYTWHWCDYSDGYWYNESLDYKYCDTVVSITCG